jgi:hypothetical protein
MGYNKALQILFNKAKLENIDEATLNTAMVGCILDGKLKTLKILCENARSQWLNSWQKQLTNNPRSAVSHTKDAFGQGLKIIRNEIAKRKIVKKFSESTNKEIEI